MLVDLSADPTKPVLVESSQITRVYPSMDNLSANIGMKGCSLDFNIPNQTTLAVSAKLDWAKLQDDQKQVPPSRKDCRICNGTGYINTAIGRRFTCTCKP